jgi:Fe-S-cluster containining protein
MAVDSTRREASRRAGELFVRVHGTIAGGSRAMKRKLAKKARTRALPKERPGIHTDAEGRVHLALQRDAGNGQAFVTLAAAIFEEQWQNEVAAGAANTAFATLEAGPSVARAIELARSVMAATSRLADGFLARAPAGSVACRAGCDHCCHQSVGVTAPEALAISAHLKAVLSRSELALLTARVSEAHERTRGLSSADRFSPEHPCVFLESGRCSIYEVRPLSCRGMNSLDANECAKRLRDPEVRAEFLANGAGAHSFMEPIRAFHAVSAGLQLALSELFELDMRPLDLIAAIELLLTEGDSIPREWIAGRPAFEAARGGDATHDLGIRVVSGAARPTL